MKAGPTMPGLIRSKTTVHHVEALLAWTYRELRAQQRWPWYRARRPMGFLWDTRPSLN